MDMKCLAAGLLAIVCTAAPALAAPAGDSQRLGRAKDYIADEQWAHAIAELKAAVNDPKEPSRDEALFWLAHSEYQAGDPAAAIETVARLERDFPSSRWVRPARSLRVEIAERLRRDDVLWYVATPPPPPPPALPAPPRVPTPAVQPTPAAPPAVAPPAPPTPAPRWTPAAPPPPAQPRAWIPAPFHADTDLRIEALSSLIRDHPDRVIPLLKDIALDNDDVSEARRAIFVLAQSGNPAARRTIVDLAREATETVRIAAVRELGRFGGADVTHQLLRVYADATPRVKREVVISLGDHADAAALVRIARTESDPALRDTAIVTLGRAGAREPLRTLYADGPRDARHAVITALFNARDVEELARIARTDPDPDVRRDARERLRLLGRR
jgi:HEAT repeat protein